MSTSAVEDLVFKTVSEKGPQSVQDIEATLKTLPAAVGKLKMNRPSISNAV
jgi:hypothetical protein